MGIMWHHLPLISLLSVGSVAQAAGLNAHGKLLYMSLANSNEINGRAVESTVSYRLFGGGVCYFVDPSWCVGLDLLSFQQTNEVEASAVNATTESDTDWWGTGVSIAYISKPWFLNGIYYVDGERSAGDTTLMTDIAYGLELGYFFDARGLGFGPMLSYVKFNYGRIKNAAGNERLDDDPADSLLLPAMAVSANF